MASWHLVVNLVGHHLIPCLLASAVIYIALGLLFRLGRLRRPADRAAFLYVALLKAGLALWVGAKISSFAAHGHTVGHLAFRLPDLVPDGTALDFRGPALIPPGSELAGRMLLAILTVTLLLLCYRWIRLAPVYRAVYRSRRVGLAAFPEASRAFEKLVARAYRRRGQLREPKLMIIRDAGCLAFVMGIRAPVVVLSADLAGNLGGCELEAIMAHEVAHVRRLDHVGRWMATVLRDIMAWNPFVVLWYRRLLDEQEMACDEYAANLLGDPVPVASALVQVAAYSQLPQPIALGPLPAWRPSASRRVEALRERVGRLAESLERPPRSPGWRASVPLVLLLTFVAIQPHVTVRLLGLWALLTRVV